MQSALITSCGTIANSTTERRTTYHFIGQDPFIISVLPRLIDPLIRTTAAAATFGFCLINLFFQRSLQARLGLHKKNLWGLMVRDILQSQKVKGQGHQAALLSVALTRKAAAVWERIRRGKVLLLCVCSASRGAPTGEEGRRHIVSPRAQLVARHFQSITSCFCNISLCLHLMFRPTVYIYLNHPATRIDVGMLSIPKNPLKHTRWRPPW